MAQRQRKPKPANRRPTLRGRGDYSEEILALKYPARLEAKLDHLEKSINKKVGPLSVNSAAGKVGKFLGNFAGQGELGQMAGSALAKYFGHGDYRVKGNSLMEGNTAIPRATFSKDGRRGTRITEREYLGDIISGDLSGASTVFTIQEFLLNPTSPGTFPWLSRLAHLYDQWEPNGIVFEFVSTSSEFNGSSQALGTVIMATDYDPYDPSYATKQEMENSDYSCSTKPALSLTHGIECDPRERPTPVLFTSTSNGAPETSFSLGTFTVATQGCSVAGVNLGELWVSYDLTFFKKQLTNELAFGPLLTIIDGSTPLGGGYFNSPTNISRVITRTPLIGVGSRINFNNTTVPTRYAITVELSLGTVADVTALAGGATYVGCALNTQISSISGAGVVLLQMVVTTNAAFATWQTGLNAADSATIQLAVVEVPGDYIFS